MMDSRSPNWSFTEVRELIEFLFEFKNEFDKCSNKKECRLKIEVRLAEDGIICNEIQIKKKIESLKARFYQEKMKFSSSGSSPSTWEHYDSMAKLLHKEHSYKQDKCIILKSQQQVENFNNENINLPSIITMFRNV